MNNIDSFNTYLFNQGRLNKAYDLFGAHLLRDDKLNIVSTCFRVYAPNAKFVSLVGDFNNWDVRKNPMNEINDTGIFEITFPYSLEWNRYKYAILTKNNELIYKADPYAFFSDLRPETSSKVYDIDFFNWTDEEYLKRRYSSDQLHEPLCIYEMNIGSWMKKPDGTFNKYNELPQLLIPYLKKMSFNAVEFMPLGEFPLDESWGYQGTSYYSITSRYGVPKDFMYLVDELHKANIKVILDWVPGHICKDGHGLYNFDGSFLFEFDDEHRRENTTWGTANIDFSKGPARSYFVSNAIFLASYFHIDGFRLDAVSNIYYYLGNSDEGINESGVDFLKQLCSTIKEYDPNIIISAEDSTTFPNVTKPTWAGGVGFDYKWNMGWMNDTLRYFKKDPIYRKYHHNNLTFSLMYAFSENFILPLSHDEVVHGKGSLIEKMPNDYWQKFSNYRALLGFMYTHPGKKLLFMGSEFAQFKEWNELEELDWFLLQYDKHRSVQRFVRDLNRVYLSHESLYINDDNSECFRWIDADNNDQSIYAYERHSNNEDLLVVLNLTPNTYNEFNVGVSLKGKYTEILNSDKDIYGGSNLYNGLPIESKEEPMHNKPYSVQIEVAPLSISIFKVN